MRGLFLVLSVCLSLESCSVKKGNDQKNLSVGTVGKVDDVSNKVEEIKSDPNLDNDGDKVTDQMEIEKGSDPLIADVPSLESNFFQNFTIKVDYHKLNDSTPLALSISTKVKDTDASFKYRVGKLFGIDNSLYYAAKEGRFSGHSYGVIKNEDYSWVKYPEIDPLMLHSDVLKYRPIIDGEDPVTKMKFENYTVNISLESTLKLTGVKFKEIKDLSVNFYFHDFEKDSYTLLKNVLINRSFQKNINENFVVEIENVPVGFLRDSYLKHGEFIISEIDNYFIPELNVDYKTLISSVKTKTVPVLLTTPSEDSIYYVATKGEGISFLEVLSRVFVKNYEVENNNLKRIGQYQNNLGTFDHLIEVKDKDKLGNWFVLTNKFKEHFMDHQYLSDDHITLSYFTGKTLATQPEAAQASYNAQFSTSTYNESALRLGLVSPNSKVEIQLKGLERFGHEAISTPFGGSFSKTCPNCTPLQYSCEWIANKRVEFSKAFDLPLNYNEEWEKIFLVINEERFKLSTLIAEKKVIIQNLNFSYQISIDDISKIKPITQAVDNNLSLVMVAFLERKHQGVKLISSAGNTSSPWCSWSYPGYQSTMVLANGQFGGEIAKSSIDAAIFEREIQMMRTYPNSTGAASVLSLKMMDDIDYEKNYSLAISTKIINYFN